MQLGDQPEGEGPHISAVEQAIDSLPENMKDVIRAVFYEQVPYSELGQRLGCSKTQAWRKARAATAHLATLISTNPAIIERYNVYESWDDAAEAIIAQYDRARPKSANVENVDYCVRRMAEQVRGGNEPAQMLFFALANECVGELKERNLWHPQAMLRLLCAKQHDYGHDNINAFGLIGVAVRISDKAARLRNLQERSPMNETLLDTWLDLIGYCVIAEMLVTSTFNLNLKEAA